jgi:predicted RND superfamily exporter protein
VDLLPKNSKYVENLEKIKEKLGGFGYLVVVIESNKPHINHKFAEDLAKRLRQNSIIKYVLYKIDKEFFRKHILLYMDYEDLLDIYKRLLRKKEYEISKARDILGIFEEKKVELDFSDIVSKYRNQFQVRGKLREYYESDDGSVLIMLIKPKDISGDLAYSIRLVRAVEKEIKALSPSSYYKYLKVGITGRFKKKIEQGRIIKKDASISTLLAGISILLIVIMYFRHKRAIIIIFLPLIMSIIWTLAFTYIMIGYINIITAFLVSILMGLGIDYGLHLFARQLEERRRGEDLYSALVITLSTSGISSLNGAITTAVAFYSLMLSEFKAFKEFGFIAGSGILFAILSMFFVFPALVIATEKISVIKSIKAKEDVVSGRGFRNPLLILLIGLAFTIYSVLHIKDVGFEYNISKIQSANTNAYRLEKKVNRVFSLTLSPTVIDCKDISYIRRVRKIFSDWIEEHKGKTTIRFVQTVLDFMPDKDYLPKLQQKKIDIIKKIKALVDRYGGLFLSDEQKKLYERYRSLLNVEPITVYNLPLEIRNRFIYEVRDKTNRVIDRGFFSFIYPRFDLDEVNMVMDFVREIETIERKYQENFLIASEEFILADILFIISRDGPRILTFIGISILIVLLIYFRSIPKAIMVVLPLAVGIIWMFGIMYIFGLKFNFLNIIVIPIIIGIGIDNGIHIYHRYEKEGFGSLLFVLKETGFAVFLCTITTTAGFGSLLIAHSTGLRSIGLLAVIGISSTFIVAIVLLPALIQFVENISFWKEEGV